MTPSLPTDPEPDPTRPASNPDPKSLLNSRPAEPISPGKTGLTPEEQMLQFEDDLKENDWGHQPC